MSGRVEAIWTAEEGSAPMQEHDRIEAVPGGLAGDRYRTGRGYYSGFDECEVTFIEREAIEEIRSAFGIDLSDGRHRRNVVTSGVDVRDLLGHRFRVGNAIFEGTRPRPPCVHVEQVADEVGVAKALGEQRGGICASVVDPGAVAVGDDLEPLEPAEPDADALAESIRNRLRNR
jgi:MOSC domain-containing protein YiiM